ncbi:zinc dependent phospholipase C family protein [Eggerthella sp. YY7918]|uniref:zinc dependent phospholipase C family protein n=1 Tax=Eggerthella sp. (strain YY7918) TaxID=502558 RepID=UPI000217174D|nr:zinc dependent phospholipase C family protein [Eggerthella sp. YY7918]BAK45594.1 putative intracellular protease [Eggerthella sp. YY7918]
MPALITHDFFGRDVYDRLYDLIGGSRDEAEAFLLGNQGPDPLFYTVLSPQLRAHNRLGNTMHNKKPSELLAALKDSLKLLNSAEAPIGRAYALGFLCHYVLDSTMHPFVFFHEYQLCDAGEPGLSRADGSEVHAVIESELDELVLFKKREATVAEFNPSSEILKASDFVLRTISKMYVYVAITVYGLIIPETMFKTAVEDFRIAQRAFFSPRGVKRAIVGRAEQLARPYSFFRAMSHRPVALTESAYDNRDHKTWENPFTGEVRTLAFWDLYDEALAKARADIQTFDQASFDVEDARSITGDRNFSGEPVVALLVSVD